MQILKNKNIPYFIFIIQFGFKLIFLMLEKMLYINLPNLNYLILLLLFLHILLFLIKKEQKIKINVYSILTVVLFFSIIIIELTWGLHFYNSNFDYLFKYFIDYYLNHILIIVLMFYIGYNSKNIIDIASSNNSMKYISYLIYSILILLFIYALKFFSKNGELFYGLEISYIYLGDMFAIFSIFFVMHLNKIIIKTFYMFLSLLFLFQIGSRSSLVFILIVVFISIVQNIIKSKRKWIYITLIPLSLSIYAFFSSTIHSFLPDRIVRILTLNNLLNDYSFVARSKILSESIKNIVDKLYFGSFFIEFRTRNGWGLYIHNILSYLEEYGLFVFIILSILIIYSFIRLLKLNLIYRENGFLNFCLYQSIFIIFTTVFTRSYIYHYIWIVFGMLCYIQNYMYEHKLKSFVKTEDNSS